MALMPKRVKWRKSQRGKVRGVANKGNTVAFGEFGLQCLGIGWITARQIEAGRVAATHYLRREGKVYVRIFPHKLHTSPLCQHLECADKIQTLNLLNKRKYISFRVTTKTIV